jgi:glycosyltransferase involved in cell wall biosynthesis
MVIRMARIVVLHPGDDSYGLDRVALATVLALRGAGHEVRLVLDSSNPGTGWLSAALEANGFPLIHNDLSHLSRTRLRTAGSLASWVRGWLVNNRQWRAVTADSDLVYLNGLPLVLAAVTLRLSRRRVLWHLHEIPTGGGRPLGRAVRVLSRRRVCVSRAVAAAFGLTDAGTTVVPNGVVVPDHGVDQQVADGDLVRIGIVARRNAWKGHLVLIRAVHRLLEDGIRFELHLTGGAHASDPASDAAIESALEPLRVAVVVVDHGQVADGSASMRDLHVLVAPSLRPDPFPLSVLEGMANGLAVVASAIGGHTEQITDGVTGRLIPPNDPEALGDALAELVQDGQLRHRLGRAARALCSTEFSEPAYADRIVAAVDEALS